MDPDSDDEIVVMHPTVQISSPPSAITDTSKSSTNDSVLATVDDSTADMKKRTSAAVQAKKRLPTLKKYVPTAAPKPDDIKQDLIDLGFTQQHVKEAMARKDDGVWDSMMQRPHSYVPEVRRVKRKRDDNEDSKANKRSKRVAGRAVVQEEAYEPLYLGDRMKSNWVLFDPYKSYEGDIPESFEKFVEFVPGHTHILEFNIVSQSVRVKSTPAVLVGKTVNYSKSGPNLVEGPPPKRGPGRPRKYPKEPENQASGKAQKIVEAVKALTASSAPRSPRKTGKAKTNGKPATVPDEETVAKGGELEDGEHDESDSSLTDLEDDEG